MTSSIAPHPPGILKPGTPAPFFSLPSAPNQNLSLLDFLGRPVILVFYPADWSPVCSDQLALYNEILDEFKKHRAAIVGVSADSIWSHAAFTRDRRLRFPLLSDFEPKGEVARRYGVYDQKAGVCERALFVIAPHGFIHWSHLSPAGVNPGADGILDALESLDNQSRQEVSP